MRFIAPFTIAFSALVVFQTFAYCSNSTAHQVSSTHDLVSVLTTRFNEVNTTHDGKLTYAQAAAGMPVVARFFNEIDVANAGYVTLQQLEDFERAQHLAHA